MARQSVIPQITASIISLVKTRDMKVGEHLPSQLLADAFRVSRAPVNAALRVLETRGVVRSEPHKGFFLIVDGSSIELQGPSRQSSADDDDALYFRIAEERLDGRLPERISENELMRLFDVTRGRLLRTLHRIAEEGWIERLPGNGWVFRETLTSRAGYEQGYVFRGVIEQQAMMLPTFRLDAGEFRKARAVQTALLEGGWETWSRAEIFRANNDYHEMLVACSRNEFFLDAIRKSNRVRRLIEYRVTTDRSRLPNQTREHLHILDLLESGNRQEAAAFLYAHIMGAGRIKTVRFLESLARPS